MGLRDKAEAYLQEKKDTLLRKLEEQGFRKPFSYDEWLIAALLRDKHEEVERYKEERANLLALEKSLVDVEIIRRQKDLESIERIYIYSLIGRMKVKYCLFYFKQGKTCAIGKSTKTLFKHIPLIDELPPNLGDAYHVEDETLTKPFADVVPTDRYYPQYIEQDDVSFYDNASITLIQEKSGIAGYIVTGEKIDGSEYVERDYDYLFYISNLIGIFFELDKAKNALAEKQKLERQSSKEEKIYTTLYDTPFHDYKGLVRNIKKAISFIGVKEYMLIARNYKDEYFSFAERLPKRMPSGFPTTLDAPLFKSAVKKKTHSALSYVGESPYGEPVEMPFTFLPFSTKKGNAGALIVFSTKNDAWPEKSDERELATFAEHVARIFDRNRELERFSHASHNYIYFLSCLHTKLATMDDDERVLLAILEHTPYHAPEDDMRSMRYIADMQKIAATVTKVFAKQELYVLSGNRYALLLSGRSRLKESDIDNSLDNVTKDLAKAGIPDITFTTERYHFPDSAYETADTFFMALANELLEGEEAHPLVESTPVKKQAKPSSAKAKPSSKKSATKTSKRSRSSRKK